MSDGSKAPGEGKKRRRRRRPKGPAGSGTSSPAAGTQKNAGDSKREPRKGSRRGQSGKSGGKGRAGGGQQGDQKKRRSRRGAAGRDKASAPSSPAALPPKRQAAPVESYEAAPEVEETEYGTEFDTEPAKPITLAADLPALVSSDDPDPVTSGLTPREPSGTRASGRSTVGVCFQPAGKIYLYDAGSSAYDRGQRVVVDAENGPRVGVVSIDSSRAVQGRRGLKRVLRLANAEDQDALERNKEREARALAAAKSIARELKLEIKVFRAEFGLTPNHVQIYFASDNKADPRELISRLAGELGCRVDTRQTGVRDEAKLVGGIGSCGMELCCSTWLPAFVPVSIKHAKDQGLSLNPSKVSGQCGRVKCCLVYEQETYAEMRKGLPKLGKRVVTDDGEGRVVEVDVLRQRIRVSLVKGEVKVYGKGEVEPMFPSQNQASKKPEKPQKPAE